MLELRSIGKRLGKFAMQDLSLDVREGEYFVLLGPSGVGKTVLLELVAGLITPDRGEIFWRGRRLNRVPPERRSFVMMYQDYALFPHRNVAWNIGYGLAAAGVPRLDARLRVEEVARQLEIADLLERRVDAISGGEQQRVALARALVTRPQMLLLDEPLSALDTSCRLRMRRLLKEIQGQTRTTFLHVTHDLEESMALGTRIGVMLDSRVRQVGTVEELFRSPSDVEVAHFLGLQNVLALEAVGTEGCRAAGVDIQAADARPGTAHVWIKPEEILLSRQPFDSSARNQFACEVVDWEPRGTLLAVRVAHGRLHLVALVTHSSFDHLEIRAGLPLYATFKSSAIHCF